MAKPRQYLDQKFSDVTGHSRGKLLDMLSRMVIIRRIEEALNDLFSRGLMHGTCHLCIGQEAVAVGACYPLQKGDYVASTHRGHGHAVAMGIEPEGIVAELLGKEEGLCRGRGGTQHLSDIDRGFLGTNGITGGLIPIATGSALAIKMQGRPGAVLSFFGDGASNTGYFHESLNFASINQLPVIFICENNYYAMSVPVWKSTSVDQIAHRGASYSMESETVDGMDPLKVEAVVMKALDRARRGDGPTLIEAMTYRYLGHSKSDQRVYRTREEEKLWRGRDPIDSLALAVKNSDKATPEEVDQVIRKAEEKVNHAVAWARQLPNPGTNNINRGLFTGEVNS